MSDDNSSIISHVSLGTNNFQKAVEFYDGVMPTLGAARIMQVDGAVAYGKKFPEFWVQTPENDEPAQIANGTHYGFVADSKEAVHAFWDKAIKMGGLIITHNDKKMQLNVEELKALKPNSKSIQSKFKGTYKLINITFKPLTHDPMQGDFLYD